MFSFTNEICLGLKSVRKQGKLARETTDHLNESHELFANQAVLLLLLAVHPLFPTRRSQVKLDAMGWMLKEKQWDD